MTDFDMNVRGTIVKVQFDPPRDATEATFRAWVGGEWISGPTWLDVRTKVAAALKKAEKALSIEFTQITRGAATDGKVYGVHAGTGAPMVEWEDGSRGQAEGIFRGGAILRRLTDAEKDEFLRLQEAYEAADKALSDAGREWGLDIGKAIRAAQAEG